MRQKAAAVRVNNLGVCDLDLSHKGKGTAGQLKILHSDSAAVTSKRTGADLADDVRRIRVGQIRRTPGCLQPRDACGRESRLQTCVNQLLSTHRSPANPQNSKPSIFRSYPRIGHRIRLVRSLLLFLSDLRASECAPATIRSRSELLDAIDHQHMDSQSVVVFFEVFLLLGDQPDILKESSCAFLLLRKADRGSGRSRLQFPISRNPLFSCR